MARRFSTIASLERRLDAGHRRALAIHQPRLPSLSGLDLDIREGLERDGIFVTSIEALGLANADDVLRIGQQLADDYAETARRRAAAGERFLMVPPIEIVQRPQLFAWGVHERLLDIVESYVGLPAAYDGMAMLYTVADDREEATRKWHRDREDRRMVKIAIYLTDVDGEGGPFQLDTRCEAAGSTPDAAFVRSGEGKAGTVIFADTARCLHRGKPAAHDRAALFYSYFSRRPRNPFFCERSGLSRAQIAALATGFTPRQTAATLWHDALPPIVRVIPSAPI